jgi:hypothetical protein
VALLYGVLVVGLFVVLTFLWGCGDLHNGLAKAVGCDPKAVDMGYCTMPKTLQQGAQR